MGYPVHHESGYALILVLFILLVIIGCTWCYK
ncbi:YjcZ family sporulation protein [Mycoplasmatota bacterium WC44]